MKTTTCDEGHGRLPWMGHVRCANEACGRYFRHQPAQCICGSKTFKSECAKCFFAAHRSDAQAAFEMRGEIGSAGYAEG